MTLLLRKGAEPELAEHAMQRHLGPWHLTFLGVGGTIGAGIFVLSGAVAANYAGPAVALSYVLAAIGCICSALCYAEFASMSSGAGSAYLYVYRSIGEFPAWLVGWMLVLEYLFSSATVAVGWSGYFDTMLHSIGLYVPPAVAQAPLAFSPSEGLHLSGAYVNLPAVGITLAIGTVLARGISLSATVNAALMLLKVGLILTVIVAGARFVEPANWHPFVPANAGGFGRFGWSGVFRGAGVVFFAYLGFDMISTAAQEARHPERDLPASIIATLAVCTILYVAMALVMTGLAPSRILGVPNPITVALAHVGPALAWLAPLVAVAAVIGLSSALMVTIYGQSRVFLAIARDGMLPPALGRLHPSRRVPVLGTWVVAGTVAVAAAVLPVQMLGELASIGTLLAFATVSAGVMLLRRREPEAPRRFRLPGRDLIPILGIISCLLLMSTLPAATWVRLFVWSGIGVALYFAYGRSRSHLQRAARQSRLGVAERAA